MKRSAVLLVVSALIIGGCAMGMGGPKPIERDALALRVPANMTADQLGAKLQQGGYEFAILAAPFDSAWLATAATRAGLQMTRPGRVGDLNYVFFGPKAVGDTLHTLNVKNGGRVRMHDALFQLDKEHTADLILARFDSVTDIREGVRALLGYVASDVSGNAALLLAVEAATPQLGDTIAVLIRAAYTDTRECAGANGASAQPPIRLFYGPAARARCQTAQIMNEANSPISAKFLLQ